MMCPQENDDERMDTIELGNDEPPVISKGVPIKMDSSVSDSDTEVSVPEASPELNESVNKNTNRESSKKVVWILIGTMVILAAVIVSIAVPLALRTPPMASSSTTSSTLSPKQEAIPDNSVVTNNPVGSVEAQRKCFKPSDENNCDSQQSYEQCVALEQAGCELMLSTAMCPPAYSCADPKVTSVPERPIFQPESVCHAPSSQNDCGDFHSFRQCLSLEKAGCQKLISTNSCPPIYSCADEAKEPAATSSVSSSTASHCPEWIPGDECSSAESHQECLLLEDSGCQTIISTFSCPPQYRCADPIQSSTFRPTTKPQETNPESVCHFRTPDNECDTVESYEQCVSIETTGCKTMIMTAMCPPTYHCADPVAETTTNSKQDTTTTEPPASTSGKTEELCHPPTGSGLFECESQASYEKCLALEQAGCQEIISTASCPPVYSCVLYAPSDPNPEKPVGLPSNSNSEIKPEEQFCHPPSTTAGGLFSCETQESYEKCLSLEAAGCEMIISTFSCPPIYQCRKYKTIQSTAASATAPPTTSTVPPTATTVATTSSTTSAVVDSSLCPLPGDGCHTEESHQQCLALLAQTGCKNVLETAMCPPTYGCADN